jgi:Met-zincin
LRRSRVISSLLGLTFLTGAAACQPDGGLVDVPAEGPTPPESPAAPIEEAPAFLAIPRAGGAGTGSASVGNVGLIRQMLSQAQSTAAATDAFDPEGSFYLAVHRRELGKRWFLSAYLKQFFPGAVVAGAARSLGTRVVSFKIQNDKLFVFDVDDRKRASDTFTQDVIVDAYPLVDPARVGASKLKDYVLVDPAAGLNQYGVVDDAFGSGYLGFNRFVVELAFSQRFRQLKDGATFEQAFTGYTEAPRFNPEGVESNYFRASGVLGLALRRYAEGEGFVAQELGPEPLFFEAETKLVPNQGTVQELAAHWNVRPGMKPIRWLISPLVKQAGQRPDLQALGIDMVAVVKAGIESWNTAFGFPVLEAQMADPGDSFADDDKNYFIWDASPAVGFAFANFRVNPNTGEIRGASIYFPELFIDVALDWFEPDAPAEPGSAPVARPATKRPALTWQPFPGRPLCTLTPSPLAKLREQLPLGEGLPGSRKERVEKALISTVAHEIGHTLGLRHNFKGSLLPPSSSVMDYMADPLAAAAAIPGDYDVAAIRHLYGGGPRPTQPFCTDYDIVGDPLCAQFDEGADPLREHWAPLYQLVTRFYLSTGRDIGQQASDLLMDAVVGFAQRGATPDERLAAWNILVADIRVPVAPRLVEGIPTFADAANYLSRGLFTRLVPDETRPPPETYEGTPVPLPPLDPVVGGLLRDELRGNLLNLDGFRSFQTRRFSVDALKTWQSLPAYDVLREARVALVPAAEPPPPADQQALIEDLLARIQRAVTPYFNQ